MGSPSAIGAVAVAVLVAVGLVFSLDWLVVAALALAAVALVVRAIGFLGAGQSEWYDREQARLDARARRRR